MTLLLHLSDLHFRKGEVGTAMDPNAHLREELVRDAVARTEAIGAVPDAILVSGDLAFAGEPDEYGYARDWLDKLCTRCGTTLSAVFVVPGNHDVVRSIASRPLVQTIHRDIKRTSPGALDSILRGLLSDKESSRLLYEALGPYNNFAGQFFCDLLPPERTISRRDLRLNDGSVLRLLGFNSAFVSSAADIEKDLFIDPACFQITRERGVEHLVMCHHPYSWLREGDALRDFLGDVARVHLFGHEHTNRIDMNRDWVRVSASAAHPDRLEPHWEPGYNLIELTVDSTDDERHLEIRAHVRVWQERPGEFRAKTDRGSEVFVQSVRLDNWIAPVAIDVPEGSPLVPQHPATNDVSIEEPARRDSMDTLREIRIRFFKLTLSQKSAIAGKLNLLEEEDSNQPDFERFRRVFLRARDRGLVGDLDREVREAAAQGR